MSYKKSGEDAALMVKDQIASKTDGVSCTDTTNPLQDFHSSLADESEDADKDADQEGGMLQELLAKRVNASQTAKDVDYLIEYDGVRTLSTCDYQILVAKKKQGKTTALSVIMSAVLGSDFGRIHALKDDATILHFDTEQNENDHIQELRYVNILCGKDEREDNDRINSYSLLGYSPEDRRALLEQCAEFHKPSLIVIDGIIQFVQAPEDSRECAKVIDLLDRIKSSHKCAILVVIHSNKSNEDENARYTIGTNLENGCADRFSTKVNGNGIFTLHHDYSRHNVFGNDIAYIRDKDRNGIPTICSNDIVKVIEENQRKRYTPIAEGLKKYTGNGGKDGKSHNELIEYIRQMFQKKETEAKACIKYAVEHGFIKKGEGYRGKYYPVQDAQNG